MRLHWARVDAIDPKPTLTKGEVEGVELDGAPISVCVCSMTASGHEERFRPASLSGRCRLGEAILAETRGNGRDAPVIGIGGHLAMPPLPHHRAYGSVPRRFDRLSLGKDK